MNTKKLLNLAIISKNSLKKFILTSKIYKGFFMKKHFLLSTLLIGSLSFAHNYNYEITPLVGYNIAEGNIHVDDYLNYGAEIQWNNISPSIKPEFYFLYGWSDYNLPALSRCSTDFTRIGMHGVYDFDSSSRFVPFLKAGLGYENLGNIACSNNHNSAYADAGAGLKVFVLPQLALKAEALYSLKYNSNRYDSNLNLLLGLTFAFDKQRFVRKLPEPETIYDDDEDGISNQKDQCPNTPAHIKVNAKGCPLDDDEDGVFNYLDQCPHTPYDVKVDTKGCELDSDGDGVVNSKDMCPQTPLGAQVNKYGCPLDSDGDGVLNKDDKCPNTPQGVAVDTQGCQIDDDGDGVLNKDDKCPNTPKGRMVNAQGCQVDDDGDGVINLLDKCPNTPLGAQVDAKGCVHEINLNINFETGSANIRPASLPRIKKFAEFLKSVPFYNVNIVGHTDNVGTKANNLALSQKRADMVKNLLVYEGVDPDRITAIGRGESQPVASNKTAKGRAKNRRIEAILIKKH